MVTIVKTPTHIHKDALKSMLEVVEKYFRYDIGAMHTESPYDDFIFISPKVDEPTLTDSVGHIELSSNNTDVTIHVSITGSPDIFLGVANELELKGYSVTIEY